MEEAEKRDIIVDDQLSGAILSPYIYDTDADDGRILGAANCMFDDGGRHLGDLNEQ